MLKSIPIVLMGILFFVLGGTVSHAQTMSILDARNANEGDRVIIEGVITNSTNERDLRFIQDQSGGMAIYVPDQLFNQNVRAGDLVQVEGRIAVFRGLIEVGEVLDYKILSSQPLPEEVEFQGASENGGLRVHVSCLSLLDESNSNWKAGEYNVIWDDQAITLWVPQAANFLGDSIGDGLLDVIGIAFFDDSGWNLMIQSASPADDNCLAWLQQPQLTNASFNFVTVSLGASGDYQLQVVLHRNEDEQDTLLFNGNDYTEVMVNGLKDAQMYELDYQLFTSTDTLNHTGHWVSTQSASSKNIAVYFNNPIRDSIAIQWPYFTKGSELVNEIASRIDGAKDEVNLCAYNFNNLTIRSALDRAHSRGVRVRCIVDGNNANLGFFNTEFPVFRMTGSNALMHHKFIVIDPGSVSNAWLFMGGTNLTRNQLYTDPNSAMTFEDQMLAKVYFKEFETLWGGTGNFFNLSESRRSRQKVEDTPEEMFLNTIPLRSYFSPSDGTTAGILRALEQAEDEIYFSLLTFTKNEIRDLLLEKQEEGVKVRGIINNINDNGGEYSTLRENGVDVLAANQNHIHHHKYAIIDPGTERSCLIMGSHNWTQKAEDTNDENLLVLYERDLSSIFLEEFMARWCEIDPLHPLCVEEEDPLDTALVQLRVAPHPAPSSDIGLLWSAETEEEFHFEVTSMSGQVLSQSRQVLFPGSNRLLVQHHFPSGFYNLRYWNDERQGRIPLMIVNSF